MSGPSPISLDADRLPVAPPTPLGRVDVEHPRPDLTDAIASEPGLSRSVAPIVVSSDGRSQRLKRVPLAPKGQAEFDEAWLQRLIHDYPECLPLGELEPALDPFASICRELPTPRGPIDNLLMTGRGDIALVETKLFRNPEARRKVLAQVLDYATCLFAMGYRGFQQSVLAGEFRPHPKPASLYEALPEAEKLPEGEFVDAVSTNLRRGKVTIVIAGDGTRSELEELLDGINRHAGFGFRLALVELAVFRMPGGGYLVRPHIIAKTEIIHRTIVEVAQNGSISVTETPIRITESDSAEDYWRVLERTTHGARPELESFLKAGECYGIYPEFLKSLNLRWNRPGSKPINLGYIMPNGSIWTDAAAWTTPSDLALHYAEEVAAAFGCEVHRVGETGGWSPYLNGRPLRLKSVLNRLDVWLPPIREFTDAIRHYDELAS